MKYKNSQQRYMVEQNNKKRLLKINPKLDDKSGIYFLTRTDENGFKFAYIGQAKHILTRLAQHMVGYQHIDCSVRSHKFYSESNPYGWKVNFIHCPESKLDELEQKYIKDYALGGYQLRNKTSGSQGKGKAKIDEYRPPKGYRDGIKQGKITLARELSDIAEKHLEIKIKPDKANNKISQKQFEKFKELINEETYKEG